MRALKIFLLFFLLNFFFLPLLSADEPIAHETDNVKLKQLASSIKIDESQYGSGPLLHPGKTYYVSLNGSDNANGLSRETSWRHLNYAVTQLNPGDTLLIEEGEYNEHGWPIKCSGEPGRPITITAAAGHRVVYNSAAFPGPIEKTPGTKYTWEVVHSIPMLAAVWEEPAFLQLESAGTMELVDELPGTFYHSAEGKIYVHFSDCKGPETNRLAVTSQVCASPAAAFRKVAPRDQTEYTYGEKGLLAGAELTGSYVHLRGIHFRYGFGGLAVFDGEHNTVEECGFFATHMAGLVIWRKAKRNLIKNNHGSRNGYRGGLFMGFFSNDKSVDDRTQDDGQFTTDNLVVGNRFDSSFSSTLRTTATNMHAPVRTLGHPGPRNHFIGNIMQDPHKAFIWRASSPESICLGNVMTGNAEIHNWYRKFSEEGTEKILIRNNTVLGIFVTPYFETPKSVEDNWATKEVVFLDNLILGRRWGDTPEAKATRMQQARFADTAYLDYRLQSDSPFIGTALGGNKGAYYKQEGNIYYVSPEGSDKNAGTSDKEPLKSLAAAAGKMHEGDTLYMAEGRYNELLSISASGSQGKPILVRAQGKKQVVLAGAVINGGFIELEGLTVSGARGDGLLVKGDNVSVQNCLMQNNSGAGIKAQGAKSLRVKNCTFAGNGTGIMLQEGSTGAIVRDSLFADNREKPINISGDSQSGYLASHNAYSGEQGAAFAQGEWGSVSGELLFVDAKNKDYRVYTESPAAYTGIYAGAAGAFEAVPRQPWIEALKASNVRDKSAVLSWETPLDDTTSKVYYRLKGEEEWREVEAPGQGTIHIAGLTGLVPGKEYEFQAEASGGRGGVSKSGILSFKTADKPLAPRTLYISPGGDDSADGLSPDTAWRTMRKANAEVGPGDTVLAAPGEYLHPIAPLVGGYPDMRITYKKRGEEEAAVNGKNAVAPPLVVLESRSYVTVDGFTIKNPAHTADVKVLVRGSSGVKMLNCRIGPSNRRASNGVSIGNSPDMLFEGNVIWGPRYQIHAGSSPNLVIKNNTFVRGSIYNIQIDGANDTKFFNNIIYKKVGKPDNAALHIGLSGKRKLNFESDYNLFVADTVARVHTYDAKLNRLVTKISGKTLEEWQKNSGLDKHSIQADPMFVDAEKGDFRLKPESPAIGRGMRGENIGAPGPVEQ